MNNNKNYIYEEAGTYDQYMSKNPMNKDKIEER